MGHFPGTPSGPRMAVSRSLPPRMRPPSPRRMAPQAAPKDLADSRPPRENLTRPSLGRARVDASSVPTVMAVVAVGSPPIAGVGCGGPVGGGVSGKQLQPPRIVALGRLRAV